MLRPLVIQRSPMRRLEFLKYKLFFIAVAYALDISRINARTIALLLWVSYLELYEQLLFFKWFYAMGKFTSLTTLILVTW